MGNYFTYPYDEPDLTVLEIKAKLGIDHIGETDLCNYVAKHKRLETSVTLLTSRLGFLKRKLTSAENTRMEIEDLWTRLNQKDTDITRLREEVQVLTYNYASSENKNNTLVKAKDTWFKEHHRGVESLD